MGRLMSFLGGAAKSLANTLDQDRLEKKRIEDEQRQHTQQVSWAKAAEALRINTATKTAMPTETPLGAPVKDAAGNWVQPTQVASGALVDDELNVTRPASMLPGRSIPTTDPYAPTPYQSAMLEQKQLDRNARIEAAKIRGSRGGGSSRAEVGDDGLTAYQREQLKRTDAREERLSNQSGKGSGGMTEKGWREGMDQTLSSIQGAEDGKLKSIIRQYGGDNILTGDMDTNMLRDTAFSVAETYWNERKPSNSPTALSAPPAAVAELKADPSPEAKREFDEVFGSGAADLALGRR